MKEAPDVCDLPRVITGISYCHYDTCPSRLEAGLGKQQVIRHCQTGGEDVSRVGVSGVDPCSAV